MKTETKKTPKKVSGTKEWATSNVNIQSGCPNNCKYCYAKAMAIRFGRETSESWKEITFRDKEINKEYGEKEGAVFIGSTHDLTEENLNEYMTVLRKLLEAGNDVLIVSKPDPKCIATLCEELGEYKDQILFRFTIGSADNEVLKFWEPNAPSFEDRLEALQLAYDHGYQTSVSCEPMIDNHIEKVVEAVSPYTTNSVWITDGAANVVMAHNHPSGDPSPSAEDIQIPRKLIEADKQIEIAVLDHLIIGSKDFVTRVLQPGRAQLRVEAITREAVEVYLVSLNEELQAVEASYSISDQEWKRHTAGLSEMIRSVEGNRQVPLLLKGVTVAGSAGAIKIGKSVSDQVKLMMLRHGRRELMEDGYQYMGRYASRGLGWVVFAGFTVWDLYDHHRTVSQNTPVMRRLLDGFFDELENQVLNDPQSGIFQTLETVRQEIAGQYKGP